MSTTNRKLTTILSADVEGYSRLMGVDEEGTFATLKTFRDAVARHIAAYEGRVVNTWGDGLLAEFASVVSAVRAAIDAQNEIGERNAGKPPELRMFYRIGINLGDVIVDGGDIYGDGVNIAARLQTEAPPGGILISSTVHDQVRNKLAVGFEFLGNLDVKNIDGSVPAFSVRTGNPIPAGDAANAGRKSQPAPETPRVLAGAVKTMHGTGQAVDQPEVSVVGSIVGDRRLQLIAILPALLIAINLITWRGEFWAAWPTLAFCVIGGLVWISSARVDRYFAMLALVGAMLAAINLLSWQGTFWAIWPLLAFGVVGAARWVLRGRR